jgi:hypothetical protein
MFYLKPPRHISTLPNSAVLTVRNPLRSAKQGDSAGGPLWVNRVSLTVRRSLPVFSYEQTSAGSVGTSQRCQEATFGCGRGGE